LKERKRRTPWAGATLAIDEGPIQRRGNASWGGWKKRKLRTEEKDCPATRIIGKRTKNVCRKDI